MANLRFWIVCLGIILAGCSNTTKQHQGGFFNPSSPAGLSKYSHAYANYIHPASVRYGIDERLVKSIIQVESSFNPLAVSKSNAIGLMQIKSNTSGRDVFRLKGRQGEPSERDLFDPATNIDIGTAYLSILKNQQLAGIRHPETMRYAMIVSYANGAGALLRTFSNDRDVAIQKINILTPQQFYQHVQRKHPSPQAPRYLNKVETVYMAVQ